MFKDLTTLILATGATVLALSLPLFADNSGADKTAELSYPVAPTAPTAPSGPFVQTVKEDDTAGKSSTKSTTKPSNVEETEAIEKPNAPQQPLLLEATKKGEESMPTEPIPVAPGVVSMGMNPSPQAGVKKEQPATGKIQTYAATPAKPEAPASMGKPVEMTPPQPEKNASGHGSEGSTSSMNMPTMNMTMPQINMPAINMKMPTTSMGATTTPQAVSMPVSVEQPATSVEH